MIFFILYFYLGRENIISSEIVTCVVIYKVKATKERLSGTLGRICDLCRNAKNAKMN